MAEVYANLIRRGRKTIEQVPERLREEVKAILPHCEGQEDPRSGSGADSEAG